MLDPDLVAASLDEATLKPYDAMVLMSFGGPESPDEVMPFLRRVTAGRGVPDDRLAVVAEHYYAHGGRSPINDQCRALVAALRSELARRAVEVEVLWGNRNSEPYLADVLTDARDRGLRRLVMVTTSAYPSYSSCRQYREDVAGAVPEGVQVDRIGQYALTPGFVAANAAALERSLAQLPDGDRARVLFVTHSIPSAMATSAGPTGRPTEGSYVAWHQGVVDQVLAAVRPQPQGELVYCSRSGAPGQPWLEPDVNDRLRELAADPTERDRPVVIAPIGFVSDHMEVIHDLDTEAMDTARQVGLRCLRADTVGTDPVFVSQLVDDVLARARTARSAEPVPAPTGDQGSRGPGWLTCPADCCVNLRRPDTPVIAAG